MASYQIDFQSGGVETNPSITGKTSITLPQNITDTTSTSLILTGRGVSNFGPIQQENFLRLLENFASKVSPPNPTVGQVWFDTSANEVKVFGMAGNWQPISGGITQEVTDAINAAVSSNTSASIAQAIINHEAEADPHTQYVDNAELANALATFMSSQVTPAINQTTTTLSSQQTALVATQISQATLTSTQISQINSQLSTAGRAKRFFYSGL